MNINLNNSLINIDADIIGIIGSSGKYKIAYLSFVSYQNIANQINSQMKKGSFNSAYYGEITFLDKKCYDIYRYRDEKTDLVHVVYKYNNADVNKNSNTIDLFFAYQKDKDINAKAELFYNLLNEYTDIPMIKSWAYYLYNSLSIGYISNIKHVCDQKYYQQAPIELKKFTCQKSYIIETISNGLKNHDITIENYTESTPTIKNITGLDSYLNNYSEILANKIQSSYVPQYVPGQDKYNNRLNDFDDSCYFEGMNLFYAQKCTMQSVINALETKKSTFVIGEQGSGKTIMSLGICYAFAKHDGFNAVIMCPAHLVNKWQREITKYVPNAEAYIIKNINDIIKLNSKIRNRHKKKSLFMIMSKESAKLDNEYRPNAIYSISKKAFICPHCGKTLRTKDKVSDRYYMPTILNDIDMCKQSSQNEECHNCGTKLWVTVSDNNDGWIKLGANGWFQKNRLNALHEQLLNDANKLKKQDSNILYAIEQYQEDNKKYPQPNYSRYPIAKYIRRYYKGYINYVIGDELHLYNGDSAQGEAFGQLASVAYKVIGLTGTLLNGYADSLFYMLFRTMPNAMIKEGFNYNSKDAFSKTFGVVKNVFTEELNVYRPQTRSIVKKLPGVSPLVFTKFLLDNAVFVNLSDMLDGLPNYSEYPTKVSMTDEMARNYEDVQNKIADALRSHKKIIGSITKTLSVYPDYPYDIEPVVDPESNEIIATPVDITNKETILPKEQELLNIIERKHANGEKVLVYYTWTNIVDLDERLKKILTEHGYKTEVLKASVSAQNREQWIKDRVDKLDVMLCNPSLVETGLDLLDFTTIVFYEVGYNLFTMRQSSRRSWRLGQTRPISVYYLYYENTIQEQALSLMATKLQASMAIEGKFSEEGLQALSENEDLLTQIANSIVSGIKYKVNDNCFKQIITDVYHKDIDTNFDTNEIIIESEAKDKSSTKEFDDLFDDTVADELINQDTTDITDTNVSINIDDNAITQNIIQEPKKYFRRTKYQIEGNTFDPGYIKTDNINPIIAAMLAKHKSIFNDEVIGYATV